MRRVGIEMEFKGDRNQVLTALRETGLARSQTVESYSHRDPSFWVVVTDSSVPNGGEAKSPPLDFYDMNQRRQLTLGIRAMREQGGAKPSHKAGFHIHVERDGLSKHEVGLICKFGIMFEDVLFRQGIGTFKQPRRGWERYSHPFTLETKRQMIDADFDYDVCYQLCDKYNFVNLQTRDQKTIEFRLFNSTMNAKLVQANVALVANLIQVMRLGKFKRALTRETVVPLGSMKEGWRKPEESFAHMMRILRCGGDGISNKDAKLIEEFWTKAPLPDSMGHKYALPEWVNAGTVIGANEKKKRITFEDLITGDDPEMEEPDENVTAPPGRDPSGCCNQCGSSDYCYCCYNCGAEESCCSSDCEEYEAVGSRVS